jgi:hypothetical protein
MTLNGLSGADHVFAPYGIDSKGVATLIKAGTSPVGDEKLTLSSVRLPSGKVRTELRLQVPKTQDVDVGGVTRPTVVKTGFAVLTMTTDGTATSDDRQELFKMLCSAVTYSENPNIVDMFEQNHPFY